MLITKIHFRLQQQQEKHFCKFGWQGSLDNYRSYSKIKIKIKIKIFDIETVINFFTVRCWRLHLEEKKSYDSFHFAN